MALTVEQESALAALADREIARPGLEAALTAAQSALDATLAELQGRRDVIQLACNADLNELEKSYVETIAAQQKAVDDAAAALAPIEVVTT